MEVCYVYSGIWPKIIEMTASDWASWFSAAGTVVAAAAAFWLYWRTRADAKADMAARRRILNAMLRQHVFHAVDYLRNTEEILVKIPKDVDRATLESTLQGSCLPHPERLKELQSDLMSFGVQGDESIAKFIENCRHHDFVASGWAKAVGDVNRRLKLGSAGEPLALESVRTTLQRALVTAEPALAAIESFDRP